MAPVVKAVSKAVETVVEEVGSAVEQVGETIEATIETVAKNPEILVIAVAAPYAVAAVGTAAGATAATIAAITPPITAAAITASQGGDLEDIGKAALAAYVAPQVGKAAGAQVASSMAGTATSASLQQAVVNTVASAAAGATSAAIQGGDIGETALLGAAGGAAGTVAGQVAGELTGSETVADYAERAGQVAAQGGDVGTALVTKGLQDLAKYGTTEEQAKKEQAVAEKPPTKEELADATFELLKSEFERAQGINLEGGTQVAAAEGDTMTDVPAGYYRLPDGGYGIRTDITTTGEQQLPTVEVTADMDIPDLTDAQIIDLVRAGQRRNQEQAGGAVGTTAPGAEGEPAEGGGEQRLPTVEVEAPAEDEDISDEEILDLVKIGMDRDKEATEGEAEAEEEAPEEEAIPEGEMELGGGEGEGATPVIPKVYNAPLVRDVNRGTAGLPARQVGQGYSAIVGDKEPTFGGDEGPQREVWNRRSLRLKKALGL